ncbi:hypothetical protein R9D63_004418 [Klebsiella oxytoca]|nr:hypothetical protein [Klebsiella oxytoca]
MTNNQLAPERISDISDYFVEMQDHYSDPADRENFEIFRDAELLMKELQERRNSEMDSEPFAYIIQDKYERERGVEGHLSRSHVSKYVSQEDINEHEITCTPLYRHAQQPVVQPVMFIDGDISTEDADKLAKVIREFNEEDERPLAKMARIIRENPHPTNECDMPKAQPAPVVPEGLNPETTDLVLRFASALADKLYKAEQKYGRSTDWMKDDWYDDCLQSLWEHIEKGDPRDVAAYCAFMWYHGWVTTDYDRNVQNACRAAMLAAAPQEVKP